MLRYFLEFGYHIKILYPTAKNNINVVPKINMHDDDYLICLALN